MCAEGPWFAPGYGRGDGLKLYCYNYTGGNLSFGLMSPNLTNRHVFVRRRAGERMISACVVPTVKHGGGSVMVLCW